MEFSKCLFVLCGQIQRSGHHKKQREVHQDQAGKEEMDQGAGPQKEKERKRQHLERDFQVLFLCGGSVKYRMKNDTGIAHIKNLLCRWRASRQSICYANWLQKGR